MIRRESAYGGNSVALSRQRQRIEQSLLAQARLAAIHKKGHCAVIAAGTRQAVLQQQRQWVLASGGRKHWR